MKYAVATEVARRQRLRIILESIRWGLSSAVCHFENLIVFDQLKVHAGA